MSGEFLNRVVLITGGAGYIGRKVAEDFAKEGAVVCICDHQAEAAQELCNQLVAQGLRASAHPADVTDYTQACRAVNQVVEEYGRLDILVTMAGGSTRKRKCYFMDQDIRLIRENIELNLFGQLYFAHAAAPHMASHGGGRIIFIASAVGVQGARGFAEYSAAKGGIIVLAKSLAQELGEFRITVNCVSPALVNPRGEDTSHEQFIPRSELPKDVSNVVRFLAADRTDFVTGANYLVDGGWSVGLQREIVPGRYDFKIYGKGRPIM